MCRHNKLQEIQWGENCTDEIAWRERRMNWTIYSVCVEDNRQSMALWGIPTFCKLKVLWNWQIIDSSDIINKMQTSLVIIIENE